jgi:hypothetical protein
MEDRIDQASTVLSAFHSRRMLVLNEEAAKHDMAPVPSHIMVLALAHGLKTYIFSLLSSLYIRSGLKMLVVIVCYCFFAQTSIN